MLSDALNRRVSRRWVGKCGGGLLLTAVRLHISVTYLTRSGRHIHRRSLISCWLSYLLDRASDLWWSVIVVAVLGCWLVRYHVVLRRAVFSAYIFLCIFHF